MKRITKIEENKVLSEGKLKVAAYCRVSTDFDDQLLSLEAQKAHYEAYIKSNPAWEYAGIYYDEGISGTKAENRPGLHQMVEACEHGLVDYVIVKSISRLARNTADCLEVVRKLLALGIPIFFEKENINTAEMESELLLSIMGSIAEAESVSISENTKWGIQYRFKNGSYKCSSTPYGYEWDKHKKEMVINEEQAKVVRFIFEQILAGVGTHDIAKELTRKGIPTQRGGNWTGHTINGIVRNEKYTGDCLFQKTYTDSNFVRKTNLGERDQYYAAKHHEAIVSHEIYEKANAVIDRRREEKGIIKESTKYIQRYPFSGKVFCGECGGKVKRKTYSHNKMVVLACDTHLTDKEKCTMKYVGNTEVENAFTNMLNKLIFGKDMILRPLLKGLEGQSQTAALLEIHRLEEEIEKVQEKKQNIRALFSQGILEPGIYNQALNEATAEHESLIQRKDAISYKASADIQQIEDVRLLIKFADKAEMLDGFDGALFEEFVEKIIIKSREQVVFHLKCGLELTERIG